MILTLMIIFIVLIVVGLFSLVKVSSQSDEEAIAQFEEWLNEKYGRMNDD